MRREVRHKEFVVSLGGHLHTENSLLLVTFLALLHSCNHFRITHTRRQREWKRHRWLCERISKTVWNPKCKICTVCPLVTQLRGIRPSAAVFTDQILQNISPNLSLSIYNTQKSSLLQRLLVTILLLKQHNETFLDSLHDARPCWALRLMITQLIKPTQRSQKTDYS